MKEDERMYAMRTDASRSAETFLSDDDARIVCEIGEKIFDEAHKRHEINCPNDDECRGTTPYVLQGLKDYFTANPQLGELQRLALVAEVFHVIGTDTAMGRMRMKGMEDNDDMEDGVDSILKKVIKRNDDNNDMPTWDFT